MDGPSGHATRRLVLAAAAGAGTAAVAGCSGLWDQPGASDVIAYNVSADPQVVTVTVTDAGEDIERTSRTLVLDPGERVDPVNDDGKLPLTTDYAVAVTVEDGPTETFEWEDPDVTRAPLWVLVDGTGNIRFLLEAG